MRRDIRITIDIHEEDPSRCSAFYSHLRSRGWEEQEEQDSLNWVKPAPYALLSRTIAEAVMDVDSAAKKAGVAGWSLIVVPCTPTRRSWAPRPATRSTTSRGKRSPRTGVH